MQRSLGRYLSIDDLSSVFGYVFLIVLARVTNPRIDVAAASFLASAMLTIFWLASVKVRERNAERRPNARILVWGLVAAVSLLVVIGR